MNKHSRGKNDKKMASRLAFLVRFAKSRPVILTKFYKNRVINEGDTGFRRESEGENSHISVAFYFTTQMKVANCSLDQNPTLI